jgi:hypothetical protein
MTQPDPPLDHFDALPVGVTMLLEIQVDSDRDNIRDEGFVEWSVMGPVTTGVTIRFRKLRAMIESQNPTRYIEHPFWVTNTSEMKIVKTVIDENIKITIDADGFEIEGIFYSKGDFSLMVALDREADRLHHYYNDQY